jgi:hypothetical protein
VLACVAVIVELPIPTMVITLPETVATLVSELVYEKEPLLLEDGSTIVKGASPYAFAGTEKLVITGLGSAN